MPGGTPPSKETNLPIRMRHGEGVFTRLRGRYALGRQAAMPCAPWGAPGEELRGLRGCPAARQVEPWGTASVISLGLISVVSGAPQARWPVVREPAAPRPEWVLDLDAVSGAAPGSARFPVRAAGGRCRRSASVLALPPVTHVCFLQVIVFLVVTMY